MKLKVGRPWFTFILKRFVTVPPTALFTVGNTIYAPGPVTEDLRWHERTHQKQQARVGWVIWWVRWILDSQFRYDQELEAYRAQYQYFARKTRGERARALFNMARAFSSPMYDVVSFPYAQEAIKAEGTRT